MASTDSFYERSYDPRFPPMESLDRTAAPLGPQVARLGREGILKLATMDAAGSFATGQLRAVRANVNHPYAAADHQLVDALTDQAASAPERSSGRYEHPLTAAEAQWSDLPEGPPEPITAAAMQWVQDLPDDPAKVESDDIALLTELYIKAPQGDRRFLSKKIDSIREHHDRELERAELQAVVDSLPRRSPTVEARAIDALTERIREESPDLYEQEARNRAKQELSEAIAAADEEHRQRVEAARERLSDLAYGAAPRSSATAASALAGRRSYEGGQERARRELAKQSQDVFAGMPRVGT